MIKGEEKPLSTPSFSFVRHEYLPVRMEYREGVDKAEDEWASVKVIPSCVRLSMCGVCIWDFGLNAEMSP